MTDAGPYALAADQYWQAGWHGVLPLPAQAKKNPPSGYTGSTGAYPHYADVYTWVEDKGAGNIALRMPPNVIGLDVDDYGDKEGGKTLTLAESMHGILPATWRTTSRDDGVSGIRLYRVPEGLAWPGEIGHGTEVIQRNHRYALVWPSLHPEGRTYRWIGPDGIVSTIIPDPDDLPFLPDTWVDAYTGNIPAVTMKRNNIKYDEAMAWVVGHPLALAEPCERMGRVIDKAPTEIGNGSAHNPARDYALRIVRLTEEQHSGGIAALVAARNAFVKDATDPNRVLLGKACRTDTEAAYEWAELVASAVGLVSANPTGMATCDCAGQLTGAIIATPQPESMPPAPAADTPAEATTTVATSTDPSALLRAKLKDGEEFILNIPAEIPTIWGNGEDALWVEGEALMIAGPPGVGKTTLTGQVLRGLLGLQSEVLGFKVKPADKILYLAMDRPSQIRRALGRAFHRSEADVLRERVEFWEGPPPGDFAKHPDVFLALAQLAGATHVIVDSLKDAAIGLSEDEVGAAYNRARQKALAGGVQVLELHHMVKRGANGNKPTELADVYGSGWLTAGAGSVLLLWGAAGDPVVDLRHLKIPVGEVGPYRLMHDHDTGTTSIFHAHDMLGNALASGTAGVTAKAMACQIGETDKPTRAQIEKARRQLDKLVKQDLLEKVEGDGNPFAGAPAEARYRSAGPVDNSESHGHDYGHARSRTQSYPQVTDTVTDTVTVLTQKDISAGQSGHGVLTPQNAPATVTNVPPSLEGGHASGPDKNQDKNNTEASGLDSADFLACNQCGEEYLAIAIEMGHGFCPECVR